MLIRTYKVTAAVSVVTFLIRPFLRNGGSSVKIKIFTRQICATTQIRGFVAEWRIL